MTAPAVVRPDLRYLSLDLPCRHEPHELFFPHSYSETAPGRAQVAEAKTVCRSCPGRADCLAHALATEAGQRDLHGIRGGLTPDERRPLVAGVAVQVADEQDAHVPPGRVRLALWLSSPDGTLPADTASQVRESLIRCGWATPPVLNHAERAKLNARGRRVAARVKRGES